MGRGKSWRSSGTPSWFVKDGTVWVRRVEVDDRGRVRERSHPVIRKATPKRNRKARRAMPQPKRTRPRIRPAWLRVIEGGRGLRSTHGGTTGNE